MRTIIAILALLVGLPTLGQSRDVTNPPSLEALRLGRFYANIMPFVAFSATQSPIHWNATASYTNVSNSLAPDTGVVAYDRHVRARLQASSTLNANARQDHASKLIWRGVNAGEGGFTVVMRVGIPGALFITGHAFACGWTDAAPTYGASPSTTVLNGYYMGLDGGQTTLRVCSCDGAGCDCTDTSLPVTDGNYHFFTLTMTSPGAGATPTWTVADEIQGTSAAGAFSATVQPSTSLFLADRVWSTSLASGAVAPIDYWGVIVTLPY
jgi:hypothetical protein